MYYDFSYCSVLYLQNDEKLKNLIANKLKSFDIKPIDDIDFSEKDFPLSLDQLNKLISSPAVFAGLSLVLTLSVKEMITERIKNKISKVELTELR